METYNTFIKFVESNIDIGNAAQTSDPLLFLCLILIVLLAVSTGFFLVRQRAFAGLMVQKISNLSRWTKAFCIGVFFIIIFSLTAMFCLRVNNALANDAGNSVNVSESVNATVGFDIQVDDAYIQNNYKVDYKIRKIRVKNISNYDLSVYRWKISSNNSVLYDKFIGEEQEIDDFIIPVNSSVNLKLSTNMPIDIAKTLINSTPLKIEYDFYCDSPIVLDELYIDKNISPQNLVNTKPIFSWDISKAFSYEDQSAYEIIVKDASTQELMWDSGKVTSNEKLVPYSGDSLKSKKNYNVFVTIYNADGSYKTSKNSSFSIGDIDTQIPALDGFISNADAPDRSVDGVEVSMPVFRKDVFIEKEVSSVKLLASGLGVYEAYLNGNLINSYVSSDGESGQCVLQPGFTQWDKHKFYTTFNVDKSWLNAGLNTLSAVATPAWWSDEADNYHGKKDAFNAKLQIIYADGTYDLIGTDANWKTDLASPVLTSSIFEGETYDARIPKDWSVPSFNDKNWKSAYINQEFVGEIIPWSGNQIIVRDDLERKAESVTVYNGVTGEISGQRYGKVVEDPTRTSLPLTLNPGDTALIDFGQNASGWEKFSVAGDMGTQMTIRHAEMLNDNMGEISRGNDRPGGSAYYANLRTSEATTKYILSGDKNGETYHPSFTFYGFRYIEIIANAPITLYDVVAQTVTSVTKDTGDISVSSSKNSDKANLVNQIVHNARWGMYSNYLSVPTDCPQRDERQGWTADTQVFSEPGMFLGNAESFLSKWCMDLRDSQKPEGDEKAYAYPPTAPLGNHENGDWGGVGWADAGIIVPYNLYMMYGNTDIILQNWQSMENYVLKFIPTQDSDDPTTPHRGPVDAWGDWLAPPSWTPDDINNGMGVRDVCAVCYYCWDLKMMEEMGRAIGKSESELQPYINKYNEIKAWFQKTYLNEGNQLSRIFKEKKWLKEEYVIYNINVVQTCYLYPIFLDLFPDEVSKKDAENALVDIIVNKCGNKLQTGFLGTKIILDTLSKMGRSDLAYTLLMQEEYPSWLYPVKQGATTFWERWNSYSLADGFGSADMNSFNHYAYGAVIGWMFKTMAGINSDFNKPGFSNVLLEPYANDILNTVNASYDSKNGKITVNSSLDVDGKKWEYHFSVEPGQTATLKIPKKLLLSDSEMQFSDWSINNINYKDLNLEKDGAVWDKEKSNDEFIVFNIQSTSTHFSFPLLSSL